MILSAHQPAYLPWLGYFAKMASSDAFVLHDLSPIGRGNMLNRNKIRTADGPLLLTVPLDHRDLRAGLPLNRIRLVDDGWARRHWRAIQLAYRRAPFFADHADFLADYYRGEYSTLDELCRPFIEYCVAALKLDCAVHWMSELGVTGFDRRSIIPLLCERFGARSFVVGPHAGGYLDPVGIDSAGIELRVFDYDHPRYRQSRPGFVSHLSIVDLLVNCGPGSADVIRGGA
ncbi:MAG TPA: WbqC family protein [Actinophytocola sp.]|uniref:WbqC family protein n=1 Tax=Actinophytocola sp. TaxID=1872138 RepID=UPI002DF81C14|nr:WbqC family protein [Actinophytocola sp.]